MAKITNLNARRRTCSRCDRATTPRTLAYEGADLCLTCYLMIESGLASEAAVMESETEAEIMAAARRRGWVDVTSVAVEQVMGGACDAQRLRDARKTAAEALISLERQGRLDQHGDWLSQGRPERGGPMFVMPKRTPGTPRLYAATVAMETQA